MVQIFAQGLQRRSVVSIQKRFTLNHDCARCPRAPFLGSGGLRHRTFAGHHQLLRTRTTSQNRRFTFHRIHLRKRRKRYRSRGLSNALIDSPQLGNMSTTWRTKAGYWFCHDAAPARMANRFRLTVDPAPTATSFNSLAALKVTIPENEI